MKEFTAINQATKRILQTMQKVKFQDMTYLSKKGTKATQTKATQTQGNLTYESTEITSQTNIKIAIKTPSLIEQKSNFNPRQFSNIVTPKATHT